MFDIYVSSEIISYVENLIQNYNFGQRGFADGNSEEQKTGIIGQTVVQELFNKGRPSGGGGFDNGIDFVFDDKKIDVKTMGRTVKPEMNFVNNFIGLQKDYKTDIIIFCSFNKNNNQLTICGWITKNNFFNKAKLYPQGTKRFRRDGTFFFTKADLYELENKDLNQVNSGIELIRNIKELII